jgi:L-iditol 2-dehydrogenase
MRALILERPGSIRLVSVPSPEPGPGELVVRVKAATTCGTDLKAYLRGHPQIPMPGPFGHEYSGVVAAAGPGAPFDVGTEVMGVHSAPCQSCRWCLGGQENLCESIMATKVLGSYAEYLVVPERIARLNVFIKPKEVPFAVASLLEPLACVAQGVSEIRASFRNPAQSVLVIGTGAIGLMFAAAFKRAGVASVTMAGRNPVRLAVGENLGARTLHWPDVPEGVFDLVVECTGQVEVWERSIHLARKGGTVVLFGGCPGGSKASFDTRKLHYDQITLLSPFHFGTAAVRTARDWLVEDPSTLAPLISGHRGLYEADRTFADLKAGKGIKYVFQP